MKSVPECTAVSDYILTKNLEEENRVQQNKKKLISNDYDLILLMCLQTGRTIDLKTPLCSPACFLACMQQCLPKWTVEQAFCTSKQVCERTYVLSWIIIQNLKETGSRYSLQPTGLVFETTLHWPHLGNQDH